MPTQEGLNRILENIQLADHGTVVFDNHIQNPEKTCVVIRHFHGNSPHIKQLYEDAEFERLFLVHQNRVRITAALLLDADPGSQFIIEGRSIDNVPDDQYFAKSFEIEHNFGLDQAVENVIPQSQPTDAEWGYLRTGYVHFMSESHDHLLGSHRQAGAMIQAGDGKRVHGINLGKDQIDEVPFLEAGLDWWGNGIEKVEMTIQTIKHNNLVSGIREKISKTGSGVVVIGASHTKSGAEAPPGHCRYLEEQFSEELPNTRLVVLEPVQTKELLARAGQRK